MERPKSGRFVELDALRGVAATAVVLYHAARLLNMNYHLPLLMSVFQAGDSGVDLFFVISGFIILFIHYDDVGRPERMRRYVWRRFTRIMPIYWIALALTLGLVIAGGHSRPSVLTIFWSAALLPSYRYPIVGVAWTLQYEVVFYVIFCLLIVRRSAGLVIFGCWLSWIILRQLGLIGAFGLPGSLSDMYSFEFFLGMGGAYWLRNHSLPAPRLTFAVGAVLFVIVACAEDCHLINGEAMTSRMLYGPAALLIIIGLAEAGRHHRFSVPPLPQILGSASYSIYLFQFIFIGVIWKLWLVSGLETKLAYVSSYPLLVAGGVVGGIAMSKLVEYPLMNLIRQVRLAGASRASKSPDIMDEKTRAELLRQWPLIK